MFEMCRWTRNNCEYTNDNVFDQRMYVGRIQFNLNDGKKDDFYIFKQIMSPSTRL